tara:strand:- start:288 stop:776 length:489 start_codon:yes stop_codon:yes gene_type:complete
MNETNQIVKNIKAISDSKQLKISVAESCTGGLISKLLTDVPGSSSFFDSGIVSYSNLSKKNFLGVTEETLFNYGAVSENTVVEMAQYMIRHSSSSVTIAVSGIMGPNSDNTNKPIGLVWICVMSEDTSYLTKSLNLKGSRIKNRENAAHEGLTCLYDFLSQL